MDNNIQTNNGLVDAEHNKDISTVAEDSEIQLVDDEKSLDESEGFKDVTNKTVTSNSEEVNQQNPANYINPNCNFMHDEVKKRVEERAMSLGLANVNIDMTSGNNLGDNFMGFIGKLTVSGTDEKGSQQTFQWIIKTAPNLQLYRDILNIAVLYAREALVYEEILPTFKKFQLEKRVLKPFNEYPTLIFTHIKDMMESIIMEDMKSIGYVMTDRQEPLDLNHVKLVMKTYGKLHAISYALKDQRPELYEKLSLQTKDIFKDTIKNDDAYKTQQPLIDSALESLDPVKDAKAMIKFKKFAENFIDIVKEKLQRTNQYSVIGHGDSWVNNILWKYEQPSTPTVPTNVCLLDWQVCRYGSPACDLSYFLFTCTTKDFRDKHYDDMIRLYYYTLCSHVVDLGSDPSNMLPYQVLQEELKASGIVGFYMSVFVLYIITRETSEMPEWRSNDVSTEEVEEKWATKSANVDKYRCRVRGVIIDAYEKGYLDCIE